jgi:hypothetical protein
MVVLSSLTSRPFLPGLFSLAVYYSLDEFYRIGLVESKSLLQKLQNICYQAETQGSTRIDMILRDTEVSIHVCCVIIWAIG